MAVVNTYPHVEWLRAVIMLTPTPLFVLSEIECKRAGEVKIEGVMTLKAHRVKLGKEGDGFFRVVLCTYNEEDLDNIYAKPLREETVTLTGPCAVILAPWEDA